MQANELKSIARQALEDLKGLNIVEFDVRDMTSVTDFMVIASGTSDRPRTREFYALEKLWSVTEQSRGKSERG
jgi:ribosomal silencing factor RsfS